MTRTLLVALAALALVVGIAVGIGAGFLVQPGTSGPVAVVTSPGASPEPTATATTGGSAPSSSGDPATSTDSPTPTPVPTPTPKPTPVLVPAPLTGVPVTPAVAKHHVIAIMIDDLSSARPQSGLSQASVVWQAPAEGGIPRYMALFQEHDPTAVGPVRSSRLYFIAWAAEWNAVYAHSGGSPQALALLASRSGRGKLVYNADEFRWAKYLYRVRFRAAPHNVYSDAKSLRKLAKAVGAKDVAKPAAIWQFAPDAPLDARPKGAKLVVPYLANRITYNYDRTTNTWLRSVSVEGKQFDAGTKPKTRIAPKNVVVMIVRFVPLGDKKHRLDGQVTGSGVAWISTNGKTVKGTWKKKSFGSPTRFYGADGKQVTLTIGQTFVQVVARGTKITVVKGTAVPATTSPSASPSSSP